jgi:TctA family transporter
MDLFSGIMLGLNTALSVTNLLYCFFGVLIGTLIGVIPGIGPLAAISMLFPITFHLEPTTALIMLGGIWYGASYGGSTTSILLNIPGTTSNAITCLDGYPMAQQGRGGVALLMTTVASFVGGGVGIVLIMVFSPTIAQYAMGFGAADYFAVILFGLISASAISNGSAIKGLAMVVLGVILGLVGADVSTGVHRYTFGVPDLIDGINLIALAMGTFGVAEVIASVGRVHAKSIDPESVKFRAMKPSRDDVRRSWLPMMRGASIGSFFGTLPGTGPAIAAFLAYAMEKRVAREPERFGRGAIEGIMGPEAANNAADMTSFIPTLSLGIPGSATMALMIGALMIHGIQPGPSMLTQQPHIFWGLIMSFWVGNILLLVLNIPLIGLWVRLLTVPYHLLFASVLVFICIGTFTINNSAFDIWLVVVFGLLGYLFRLLDFPAAPILLGFVLGPMLEEQFRRAMLITRGDPSAFLDRPISAVFIILSACLLLWSLWSSLKSRRGRLSRRDPLTVASRGEQKP